MGYVMLKVEIYDNHNNNNKTSLFSLISLKVKTISIVRRKKGPLKGTKQVEKHSLFFKTYKHYHDLIQIKKLTSNFLADQLHVQILSKYCSSLHANT